MRINLLLTAIAQLATLGTTFAKNDFFVMGQCSSLTVARIDPIVNPGGVAKHVHNVCGGSGFGPDLLDPAAQSGASCSSAVIGDDKSNYWAPQLYWQFPNGTYQPMIGGGRIYYYLKGDDVKPFPPGLHMITGDSMVRDMGSYKSAGVKISCNGGTRYGELPQGKRCDAISLGIFFPSCGLADGSISSEDNFSHMAWPIKQLGGGSAPFNDTNADRCPDSHPIKYPTIFYEQNYYPTGGQIWEQGTKYVLSNGDEWGPSYHADFHAGWVQSTLEKTIKQCGGYGKGPEENLKACAPLAPTVSQQTSWDCRYEGKIPNEEVGFTRPIDKLPGCNPAWPKSMDAKPTCSDPPVEPEMVYPNVYFRNLLQRTHIPIVFTDTNTTTDAATLKSAFAPSLGDVAQSFLVPWGSDGSNKAKLRVSTVANLLQSGGDSTDSNQNAEPAENASASHSSASSSSASSSHASSESTKVASSTATTSSHAPASASASHSTSIPEAVISAASSAASSAPSAPSVATSSSSARPSSSSTSIGAQVEAGSSHSAASAAASTATTMPTAGLAASPGGKTCRKGHRTHHKRTMAGHIGRRSRRNAFKL